VKAAQARLKKTFAATMARAKRYQAQGNQPGCTRELTAAKRMYILYGKGWRPLSIVQYDRKGRTTPNGA
jgi:hypothetical protein